MPQKTITTILELAIGKELAAVKFYHQLMQQATTFEQLEAIRKIELMERRHAEILQEYKNSFTNEATIPLIDLPNLDDSTEKTNTPSKDFPALLHLAAEREEVAQLLYSQLAKHSTEAKVKRLFQKLAAEEQKHHAFFLDLIQQLNNQAY
jgi:rubrerythrin